MKLSVLKKKKKNAHETITKTAQTSSVKLPMLVKMNGIYEKVKYEQK